MKKQFLIGVILAVSILMFSSIAFATPQASILYEEKDLGSSWWQYDYRFANLSDAGEYLFNVWLDFSHTAVEEGLSLPTGWEGSVWLGTNTTQYLETSALVGEGYDIAVGNTLPGFSFKVDYQAGRIPYTAYFDDGVRTYETSGLTVPEPVSSILFLSGGVALAHRKYSRKKHI